MRQPEFWDDASKEACGVIFADPAGYTTLQRLRQHYDLFVEMHFDKNYIGTKNRQAIIDKWSHTGSIANTMAESKGLTFTPESIAEVLVRKQRDYGHENIRRFGRQGLMIRGHDKIARLENLCGSDFEPNNESIEDTLLDIIGYSAIGIMWENGTFLLPLAPPKNLPELLARDEETR
jgi:hypothetical protein